MRVRTQLIIGVLAATMAPVLALAVLEYGFGVHQLAARTAVLALVALVVALVGALVGRSPRFRASAAAAFARVTEPIDRVAEPQVTDAARTSNDAIGQTTKLEAIGDLAGGVAHQFNNLLTPILVGVDTLLHDRASPELTREVLEEIRSAADQARQVTQQLLAFGGKQALDLRVVDLRTELTRCEKLMRLSLHVGVALELRVPDAPVWARVDTTQLQQILLSLMVNAQDAMPDGGRLTVTASSDATSACITVADSGHGMDAPTLSRIFEPFFTTKALGQGTGLGLATVYGIVRQHHGTIEAVSTPGNGATFTICVPRVEPVVAELVSATRTPVPIRAMRTLMVVEDQPLVASVTRRILERAGYRVLLAVDGPAAVAMAEAHDGAIAALVTDVVLPGFDGAEVARRITAQRRACKVLYLSGYSGDVLSLHGIVDDGHAALLSKPFTARALVAEVRALLETDDEPDDSPRDPDAPPGSTRTGGLSGAPAARSPEHRATAR